MDQTHSKYGYIIIRIELINLNQVEKHEGLSNWDKVLQGIPLDHDKELTSLVNLAETVDKLKGQKLVVVESKAYYEAYSHVLRSL